jgi:hypothetical protein
MEKSGLLLKESKLKSCLGRKKWGDIKGPRGTQTAHPCLALNI